METPDHISSHSTRDSIRQKTWKESIIPMDRLVHSIDFPSKKVDYQGVFYPFKHPIIQQRIVNLDVNFAP